MPHHYTKNTVAASFYCAPCGKDTLHRIDTGRRGPCLVCLDKLENCGGGPKPKPEPEPEPKQANLFTLNVG